MSEKLENSLGEILRLRPNTTNLLVNRESSQLEYKQTFQPRSLSQYVRTMLAFANNGGGYIVFGVEDNPRRLCGVNESFEQFDPATLSSFLRDHANPELNWEDGTILLEETKLGFLFTHEALNKPVITNKEKHPDLKGGSIYYRYRGQTTFIQYAELRRITDERLDRERKAWMRNIQFIQQAGPTNVGILDTVDGKLHGPVATFLIDEDLLEKIKFIRQGSFSEKTGDPTLRLVGDVHTIDGEVAKIPVKEGIHFDDFLTIFLQEKHLEPDEARNFVKETAHQNTFNVPVHYFVSLARLSNAEAGLIVKSENGSSLRKTREVLAERLSNRNRIVRIGTCTPAMNGSVPHTCQDLIDAVNSELKVAEKRSVLVAVLSSDPKIVKEAIGFLPVVRLCEALTHIDESKLRRHKSGIFSVALALFQRRYEGMTSNERSTFRKSMAYLDQQLYGPREQE